MRQTHVYFLSNNKYSETNIFDNWKNLLKTNFHLIKICCRFQLSNLEEEFIFAAEFGDIPTVKRILEEQPNFNVDFNDILGRTPLRLAVGNEHLEVIYV